MKKIEIEVEEIKVIKNKKIVEVYQPGDILIVEDIQPSDGAQFLKGDLIQILCHYRPGKYNKYATNEYRVSIICSKRKEHMHERDLRINNKIRVIEQIKSIKNLIGE